MQDLQEVTQEVHYENFRGDRLKGGGGGDKRKIRSVVTLLHNCFKLLLKFIKFSIL